MNLGIFLAVLGAGLLLSLATYDASDPSFNAVSGAPASNALGGAGAVIADVVVQSLGLAGWVAAIMMLVFGLARTAQPDPDAHRRELRVRAGVGVAGLLALAGFLTVLAKPAVWPLAVLRL